MGDEGAKHLGEGLKENKVRQNQSLRCYHIHLSYFIQTLRRLNLKGNHIGREGVQYLGEVLKKSKVRQRQSFHFYHIHLSYFTQKLAILNLEIDDEEWGLCK
jgi:hypothetical protein